MLFTPGLSATEQSSPGALKLIQVRPALRGYFLHLFTSCVENIEQLLSETESTSLRGPSLLLAEGHAMPKVLV